jgi:hypothetical protein
MKLEIERCGEEAALYSAIRLDRVKEEEDVVVAGARCQRRGVEGEGVGGEVSVVLSWSKSPRHYRLLGACAAYQS